MFDTYIKGFNPNNNANDDGYQVSVVICGTYHKHHQKCDFQSQKDPNSNYIENIHHFAQ